MSSLECQPKKVFDVRHRTSDEKTSLRFDLTTSISYTGGPMKEKTKGDDRGFNRFKTAAL